MEREDTKRRALFVIVVLLLLLALLLGIYLAFLRQSLAPAPAPQRDAGRPAPARPDSTLARRDVGPTADSAAPSTTAVGPARRGGQGTGPREPRDLQVAQAVPDAAPPQPDTTSRAPDAARKPDKGRQLGKLPPRPEERPRPARVVTRLKNHMGSSFVLVELNYEIDGRPVYGREDLSGGLDRRRDFETFTGELLPGKHTLVVRAVFRGAAHGLFKYHEGYRYKVRSDFTFTVNPGKRTEIVVEAYERGGAATPLEQKPTLKFSYRSMAEK